MNNIDYSLILNFVESHPEFIETHPDKSWNWEWLSQNPYFTPELIEPHLELDWDFQDKPWIWDPETPDQD